MKASTKTSVEVSFMEASVTSAKAFTASMKAFMDDFGDVTSLETFVEGYAEAPLEVTYVIPFISSVSFMEAYTEASMTTSVDVTLIKAFISSTKGPITSMKYSIEAFVEDTSMEAFVEAFV